MIFAWDRYERTAWQPRGFLWNDHATAAAGSACWGVLAPIPATSRLFVGGRAPRPRTGGPVRSLLADPGRFTFATNHGIMQNLALLEVGALFPTLPDRARYEQLASTARGQLSFLVDDEGVVRENSAGYQAFDLGLLGMTFRP